MASTPDWKAIWKRDKRLPRLARSLRRRDIHALEPYLDWEALRRLEPPRKDKLSTDSWWALTKLHRHLAAQPLSLPGFKSFFVATPTVQRRLDHLMAALPDPGGELRDRYLISAMTREAIFSCQLDGLDLVASRETLAVVRDHRDSRDPSLRAAQNLYRALRRLDEEGAEVPFTSALMGELIEALWKGPADGTSVALREGFSSSSLKALGVFLESESGPYVPPLVRATAIYTWVLRSLGERSAHGRLARYVFCWCARRLGLRLVSSLSWSMILAQAPKKWRRAYRQSLGDENDLTYILLHHFDTLERALEARDRHVQGKELEERADPSLPADLNPRQLAILAAMRRRPQAVLTIAAHQHAQGIVYETARSDLSNLAERGLLVQEKRGRSFIYRRNPRRRGKAGQSMD